MGCFDTVDITAIQRTTCGRAVGITEALFLEEVNYLSLKGRALGLHTVS
jgi:hypothetical protein